MKTKLHPKEKYFIKQAKYWTKRLKVKYSYILAQPHMGALAGIFYDHNKLYICYKPQEISKCSNEKIMHVLFHEIGHLKYAYKYGLYPIEYDKIMLEYIAESYAWKWLKKYYPIYYKKEKKLAPKFLKKTLQFSEHYKHYFLAYSQIFEYGG